MIKVPAQTCKAYWIIPPVRRVTNCFGIIEKSAEYFGYTVNDLVNRRKTNQLVRVRQMIMHALYWNHKLKPTAKYIGKLFNRDHSTVLWNLESVANQCETDEDYFKEYKEYHEHIYGHLDYFNVDIKKKKKIIKI